MVIAIGGSRRHSLNGVRCFHGWQYKTIEVRPIIGLTLKLKWEKSMNFKFIVNILCICLILLSIIPLSMGADEDLDYKEGNVELSVGTYDYVDYELLTGTTEFPKSDRLWWDSSWIVQYNSLEYKSVYVTMDVAYENIPSTVGDPFLFSNGGYELFRGNVYYHKVSDQGSYALVNILYDIQEVNTTNMAILKDTGWLQSYNSGDLDTISYYYNEVYHSTNNTIGTEIGNMGGLALTYASNQNDVPRTGDNGGTAVVSFSTDFLNSYEIYNNPWNVSLFVNKDYPDYSTKSSIIVYDNDDEIMLETINDSVNLSHTFLKAPMRIDVYSFDAGYSVNIWDTSNYTPPQTVKVAGRVVNGKANSLVDNAQISLNGYSTYSNFTGYYELDVLEETYTLEANHTDYMPYSIPNITISENMVIDLILSPYGINSGTGESDSTVPYLAGTVKNQNTYEPIENVYISLSNQTETYNQYSNVNGHFEIYPDSNGTYNLLAQNQDYYTFEANITIAGGTVQNILLVPATLIEVPTNETAPEDIQGAFISMLEDFGFSSEWVKIIISIGIILGCGYVGTLFTKKDNPIIIVVSMFFGFIASVALSLLSPMFLVIVIVVIVMSILYLKE